MNLPNNLLDEFAKVTHDPQEKKENTIFYGVAKFTSDGDFVLIDGATTATPATYATSAVNGDRVMGTIKNHKAIITANITNPSMTLGILRAISGIIVEGYLTTNAERVRYDDQTRTGLTFSNGGMGAYGGEGKYWYITNTGDFRAEQAYVKGTISASSGYIGSEENGFKIDEYGIYSGANKTGTSSGFITLGNTDFTRAINGENRILRFAIGANFGVTATGVLYANDADLQGKITATSGKIGNFDINGALYSNNKSTFSSNNSGVYLGTDGIALGPDNKFSVTSAGVLYAKEATITGILTAGAGSKIGPWYVAESAIYKNTDNTSSPRFDNANSFYFGNDGLSIKQNFKVDFNGNLTAKSGVIGNWTIGNGSNENNGSLYTTGTTLGNDGSIFLIPSGVTGNKTIAGHADTTWVLACGSRFGVTKNGYLYSTGGQIGDFVINNGALYTASHNAYNTNNNGVFLNKDYIALGPGGKFNVTSAGVLTASGATISGTITATTLTATTSGTIGPWSINNDALYMTSAAYGNASGIYLGKSGFSVKDVFKVSTAGYLTLNSPSGTVSLVVGGSADSNQHVQFSNTFMYVGNNATARLCLTRDSMYFNSGTYANPIADAYKVASFYYSAPRAYVRTRTYYDQFLVPVGSVDTTNRKVAALSGRSSYLQLRLQKESSDWALVSISYNNSDIRLKENIAETEVHDALSVINKIDMHSFDWKDNREVKHQKIGMIADEIEKLDPLLTIGGGYDEDGAINAKSIDVLYLVGYLVKAIQELSNE